MYRLFIESDCTSAESTLVGEYATLEAALDAKKTVKAAHFSRLKVYKWSDEWMGWLEL